MAIAAVAPSTALAQSEVLFDPEMRESINPLKGPAEALPELDDGTGHPWSIDLLLGLETGVRLRRFLNHDKGYGWMAEVYLGLDYVFFPAAGAGVRYGFAPWMGRNNCISVSPGVDIHALLNPFANSGGWFGG